LCYRRRPQAIAARFVALGQGVGEVIEADGVARLHRDDLLALGAVDDPAAAVGDVCRRRRRRRRRSAGPSRQLGPRQGIILWLGVEVNFFFCGSPGGAW